MCKAQKMFIIINIFIFIPEAWNINIMMIHDVIKSFNYPACVIGFLCNKTDEKEFLKFFTSNGLISNVLDVSIKEFPNYCLLWNFFVLDFKCKNSKYILELANQMKLFAAPNRWLIIFENESSNVVGDSGYTAFREIDILVDSDVVIANYDEENSLYVIRKVYKINGNWSIIFENYGIWNEENGYKITESKHIAANRRKNLRGTTLRTCLVITHNDSLNHLLDKRDKHIDSIAKVNFVFMLHLSDFLNANMEFSIQSTWGYINNKSEWSGMIGELTRKEADIGGTPLFLTTDRVSIIDYIAMTTPTKSKFVFRQPKLSYITNVFTLPFETTVWIAICALIVIAAVGLYITIICEWRRNYLIKAEITEPELETNFAAVLLLVFGAACQQGASAIPYTVPGRIITILLFLSLMFLYTSYSANIVALLQSSSTSIQTLNDLLNSRLQVGVDDTVFNRFYFPFLLVQAYVSAETFFENEKCDLEEIQFLQVSDPWLAIQKNSSYKEMLKIGLRKIQESGIQSREVALLYTKKPQCISRGSSFVEVTIVDCSPAIMIFAIGTAVAFVIFVLEILFYYRLRILRMQQKPSEIITSYLE